MHPTIPDTKAKNNFGELIRRMCTTGDQVVVEKDGIPVVLPSPSHRPNRGKDTNGKKLSPSSRKKISTWVDPILKVTMCYTTKVENQNNGTAYGRKSKRFREPRCGTAGILRPI